MVDSFKYKVMVFSQDILALTFLAWCLSQPLLLFHYFTWVEKAGDHSGSKPQCFSPHHIDKGPLYSVWCSSILIFNWKLKRNDCISTKKMWYKANCNCSKAFKKAVLVFMFQFLAFFYVVWIIVVVSYILIDYDVDNW